VSDAPVVAVDLGGTNTRVALVAADGRILERRKEMTPHEMEHPDLLVKLVNDAASGSGADRAVVGVPGRVDHVRGALELAPNLPKHWVGHLTESALSEAAGLRVALANDADLAAVGEFRFGAGRGTTDMVYLTLSTGVGCGVIVGGKLLHGRRSLAEAGHTTIDRRAANGERTLEQTASGTALGRLAERHGVDARGGDLVDLVRRGDLTARLVWEELVGAAGFGVANLAHLFSPEVIVIGGGLGLAGDLLYEPLRGALAAYGPRELPDPIRLVRAELGDDAGLAGAAGWASTYDPPKEAIR
jgi:glucokinase